MYVPMDYYEIIRKLCFQRVFNEWENVHDDKVRNTLQ